MAISELFLDTHLEEEDFIRLRDLLNESQLSIDELDLIYHEEIAPLLYGNLEATAGEWSGFDPVWLELEISKQSKQRIIGKMPWLNRMWGYWTTRTTKNDWEKLRRMLTQQRS